MSRAGSTVRPGAARARWVTRAVTGSNKNAGIDRRDSCRAPTEPFGAAAVGRRDTAWLRRAWPRLAWPRPGNDVRACPLLKQEQQPRSHAAEAAPRIALPAPLPGHVLVAAARRAQAGARRTPRLSSGRAHAQAGRTLRPGTRSGRARAQAGRTLRPGARSGRARAQAGHALRPGTRSGRARAQAGHALRPGTRSGRGARPGRADDPVRRGRRLWPRPSAA